MTQTVSAQARRAPRIRLGMVGGGQGAFIGGVHRIAARIDDQYELVAGCFSSTPGKSTASAAELGVGRAYGDFAQMAMREARRKDGIEAVAIVTPNHLHAPVAREFLKRGIHVICDKPLTATLPEARKLAKAARGSDTLFVLTHNYTGYPMVRQARAMTLAGELGEIRLVQVEYAQDWLAEPIEQAGNKQAGWRTDPAQSGAGGAIGDIGTHAFNLAGFVTGLELEALAADLQSFVPGRAVDDNGHVLLRYQGGARGMLWCSQVASGCENALRLRVYGTRAGIEWAQEEPNYLWVAPLGRPRYRLSRGGAGTGAEAARLTRIPAGHPEGYLEGFANIYAEAARAILARRAGVVPDPAATFPGIREGLEGVAFVDACLRSSRRNGAWVAPAL
ncbi:Gfo/Idh/MocA family protein [Paracoccus denitrificans]|jgi:predicted dehydrogenase|uniref:Oxidoreductase domain protein n=1 Tax=Paracoccus denitrificans (strain Pd 1222) TaxID=318586 RepID=A1BAF6_PARDP|nr:Gfo/Idh/MocA family oxidoreductase [Paracoccus denitrificans]ABL72500.1 oxidoreductase domain protein [Paracoccus denitrificans PD1222]MBB4626492.1 putative dehydrogenase [Paracoccus denitrificans]MCU7428866.1 Gfo/Idh/MocA family oxidoreductase [Paracoccus denitrificans]UPV97206.1 Gfo/Idh/MocA family oxidoreductase [Paracoccus denitrificans]WQO35118.1 Gfo/Idh/MocA family oxidoreductase [Paracoccus denitrificans]